MAPDRTFLLLLRKHATHLNCFIILIINSTNVSGHRLSFGIDDDDDEISARSDRRVYNT